MALFKKKQPREIKDDDPLFVKLWYNERSHALIVLGLYFVFFLFIILFVTLTGKKTGSSSIEGNNIKGLFNGMKNQTISYNYVIKEGNKTYYFSGEDKKDGIYGTILFNGDSSSVNIKNDECFAGTYEGDEFVLSDSLCPENLKYYLFDLSSIYKLIENEKGAKNSNENYYVFSPSSNEKVRIYYENDNITKITVINGNSYEYELSYSTLDTTDELEDTTEQ